MYRHKIKLQNPVTTRDAHGGFTPVQHNDMTIANWTDIATVKSEIIPLRGKQYFEAQQANSEITHRITLRFCKPVMNGIQPKMTRVLFEDPMRDIVRVFRIETAYSPHERRREIEMLCVEVV